MKNSFILTFLTLSLISIMISGCNRKENSDDSKKFGSVDDSSTVMTIEDLDWKLGAQSYTFRKFTLEDALVKMKDLGLHYVEIYNGQEIGGGVDGEIHFTMSPELREKVLQLAAANDIKIVQYGVTSGKNETEWVEHFEFAKAMGITTITSEPKTEDLDMVNDLAKEYDIKIAIHNHPQPSLYWNPDKVLAAAEGREMIGACADVGHWKRSGLDPVECLKKLEGKIFTFHIKDIEKAEKEAHDVVWGTGVCDIGEVIKEMHRQKFKGLWSIEHEANPENPVPEIEKSLVFFKEQVSKL